MKFETTLKSENIKEISNISLPKFVLVICRILLILTLLLTTACFLLNSYVNALIYLILDILIVFYPSLLKHIIFKRTMNKINEITQNKGIITYCYEFKENSINIINQTISANYDISYDNIKNWKESAHFFILITKARQTIVINKDEANEKNLQEFLKDKCKGGK